MQEARRRNQTRLGKGFARVQITIIGQRNAALLVIRRERILCHRVGEMIQRPIDSRYDEKKADEQEDKSF